MLNVRFPHFCSSVFLTVVFSGSAFGQFNFTSFSVPRTGVTSTSPTAINNNGDICGSFMDAYGTHGFIRFHSGVFTTFDEPGSQATYVSGINDEDEVSGYGYVPNVFPSGVGSVGYIRTRSGEFTLFYGPAGTGGQTIGLNNAGESIIAVTNTATFSTDYYLRSASNIYTPLICSVQYPNCTYTSLNNSGQAAGTDVETGNVLFGFTQDLTSGTQTFFSYSPEGNVQGGQFTYANGISDSGAVAGSYNAEYQRLGYVRSADGSSLDSFLVPFNNANNSSVVGINSGGEIVGQLLAPGFGSNGFIGIPSTDDVPPAISVGSVINGPPMQAVFSVVDTNSGVFNVEVNETNGSALISPIAEGQKTPVTVTVTKLNQSMSTVVQIQASDMTGNYVVFDPQIVAVFGTGSPSPAPLTNISSIERVLVIANSDPGIQTLHVNVNGKTVDIPLTSEEKKTINLKSLLTQTSSNTITFSGDGPEAASALIVLTQPSAK